MELIGTITNPNDFDVNILNDFTIVLTVDADHQTCAVDNFQIAAPAAAATTIPAKGSVQFSDGSITMVNSPTVDQAVCFGAALTLTYNLS